MHTHHETTRYRVVIDHMGHCLIHRNGDGAECYLQGDDARHFRRDKLDRLEARSALMSDNRYNILFDLLCSDYDHVMEKPR